MRTLKCFVIMPSGKNPPMQLVEDDKYGWSAKPSSCEKGHAPKEISVDFDEVYKSIILPAINLINGTNPGIKIDCTRGEDLLDGGNIVSQFLQKICQAEITISDVTGFNSNVIFEYGIRLSVRDSLNILLCHEGVKLPLDFAEQRFKTYHMRLGGGNDAKDYIVETILHALPLLLAEKSVESVENLFRRTVENATGRTQERRLMEVFEPAPDLLVRLLNALNTICSEANAPGDKKVFRLDPKLRDETWKLLEEIGKTMENSSNLSRAIELYELLTKLEGFREKRRDVFYNLNKLCSANPDFKEKAQFFLERGIEIED